MIVIVYANRDTLEASLFPGRAVVGPTAPSNSAAASTAISAPISW